MNCKFESITMIMFEKIETREFFKVRVVDVKIT